MMLFFSFLVSAYRPLSTIKDVAVVMPFDTYPFETCTLYPTRITFVNPVQLPFQVIAVHAGTVTTVVPIVTLVPLTAVTFA